MSAVGALFEVAAVAGGVDAGVTTSASGMATQMEVVAELLRRGHKVAVPVVDDDGVDLVVNYCVKVQVKFTSVTNPNGIPILSARRMTRRRPGEGVTWRAIADHVDVVVVLAAGVGFFVFPWSVVTAKRNVALGPGMDQWRGAWSVFDASRR